MIGTTDSISIIIPTYNRLRALSAVWPSYLAQSGVSRIVVVDDGSSDGTNVAVEGWAKSAPIPVSVVRHSAQRGQPASRMTGIAASESDWVLFGEDDVWLGADYCSTLLREARSFGASIIAGRIVTARVPGEFSEELLVDPPAPPNRNGIFDLRSMDADFSVRVPKPVPAPFLHSIALINKSVFERTSFDAWYSGNSWREETDFYIAANAAGAVVYFTPNAVCYHLRGPICGSGGQRINRLRFEYLAWRNTRHLVSKHWDYLRSAHGLRGSAMGWMVKYYVRRQLAQLKTASQRGIRSSYRG